MGGNNVQQQWVANNAQQQWVAMMCNDDGWQ
jgi:hypothetical protein